DGIFPRWCENHHVDPAIGLAAAMILNTIATIASERTEAIAVRALNDTKATDEDWIGRIANETPPELVFDGHVRAALAKIEGGAEFLPDPHTGRVNAAKAKAGFRAILREFRKALP